MIPWAGIRWVYLGPGKRITPDGARSRATALRVEADLLDRLADIADGKPS